MQMSELSIRRPVLATVMSLTVLLIGIVAYQRLSVREYPKIDEPVVTVTTKYQGASAEIVESQVTQPLEESLSGIEGIDVMSSISRSETSQITVRFRITREPDVAANDVRDRVGRVRGALPDEIDEPVIAKVEADAQPIIYLAFSSDRHSPLDVTDYADRFVKDRLAEPARRRRYPDLRRAALRHADLARPDPAGGLPGDPAGCRIGAAPPEHRDPGGPGGERPARVHRRVGNRHADPGRVREHHSARRIRLSGPPARCRPGGDRRQGRAGERPVQRPQRRRHGCRQAVHRQPAGCLQGGAGDAAGDPRRPA